VRIARFIRPGKSGDVSFGVVEPDPADPTATSIVGLTPHPFAPFETTGTRFRLDEVRLLAPVIPSKIVCIGKNYADHAREMGGEAPTSPVLFLKPSTSVVGPFEPIRLPADSTRVDHEAELAVVIGRITRDVTPEQALGAVLGYTCANDVTARDQQQADGQWARAKGHDTFCPLGPWIETDVDPANTRVRALVGGEIRQDGTTADLIHAVPDLIAFISRAMTLLPGDVVLTGTPAGVGPIVDGDVVTVSISGVGDLVNPVQNR
jgi:2-keto-4-pentenoate hydratase/2-oxohepta-3-ene-1,7-dioic acid hydratase in catechol pathway